MIQNAIFLTIDEAATLLRVKKSTLYAWTFQKIIPHRKHGSRIVFAHDELLEWSETQRVMSTDGLTSHGRRVGMRFRSLKTRRTAEARPTPQKGE